MPGSHNTKRRKVGARTYRNFSNEQLEKAIDEVKSGKLSIRNASEKFSIPKSTIARKVKQKNMNDPGHPTALTQKDENIIVEKIIQAGKWGFPFSRLDIQRIVKAHLDKSGFKNPIFKNNLPGYAWCRSFLARHNCILSERFAENIKRARAQLDHTTISNYFTELNNSLQDVPPEAIINFDETNITDDPGKPKVIVRRGIKYPERIMDSSKSSVSVMFTGSASGQLLPLYVVYKAEHLYDTWKEGGPDGCRYNRSKSGWFDAEIFKDYFEKIVIPYAQKLGDGPKVVLCDNLASHKAVEIIQMCEQNNIRFVLLPPNSTHLCQPLDVSYFRPLKMKWKEVLAEWKKKNRGCIPKDRFPRLLRTTMNYLAPESAKNLMSGFRACGIYPYDPSKVLDRLPDHKGGENNGHDAWNNTFEDYLRTKRSEETSAVRAKRKRLDVAPGKSVSVQDFNSANNSRQVSPSLDLDEPQINSTPPQISSSSATEIERNVKLEVTIGDFLLTEVVYDRGTKKEKKLKFISQLLRVDNTKTRKPLVCKFMRNYRGSPDTYIFPNVPDVGFASFGQIVKKLDVHSNQRGRYKFVGN